MLQTRFIALEHITSRVGITERAGYMARQESDGVRKNESGKNLAIPTNRARGGNKGSPVLKKMFLSKIKIAKSGNVIQRAAIASKQGMAMRHNDKLFLISNFEKRGGNVTFKMDQIYNFQHKETVTPQNEWL